MDVSKVLRELSILDSFERNPSREGRFELFDNILTWLYDYNFNGEADKFERLYTTAFINKNGVNKKGEKDFFKFVLELYDNIETMAIENGY